jgi:hypothetical protein
MTRLSLRPGPWEGNRLRQQLDKTALQSVIGHAFQGSASEQDLEYMAKALLQLADEVAELRKRVADLGG